MGLINLYRIKQLYERVTEARKTPRVLSDPKWLGKTVKTALAVEEIREMLFIQQSLKNWAPTLGGLAALISALSIVAHDPTQIASAQVIGLLGAAFTGLTSKQQNVTGGTKDNAR